MSTAIIIFLVFLVLGMPVAFAIGISGFSFFIIKGLPSSEVNINNSELHYACNSVIHSRR